MKTIKSLTEAEIAELPKLPDEWKWIRIGDLTSGVEYGTSSKSEKLGQVPVLRMGNIQNGRFDWSDLAYTNDKAEIEKYLLKKDDVLFNRTNSPELVGKTAIYKGERPAIFAGYLIRINQLPELVVADYLNYFLNCPIAKVYGNSVKTDGVNQSNINGEKLRNYPFPLPSLPEQRAIVSKIEQLFSELDNGISNLKLAQEQLKVYRQAVLNKAFEGELTKKWRKSNENGDIEQLLSEVNKERLKYFQNKGKKIKQVKPISEDEISELIPLPENWKRVRLNDLSFLITDGKHGDCKNHENSGYFFISAKDIFDGKINYVDARQIKKEDFEEVHKRTDLEPDDVLVTNAGTIGRIAIATASDKTSKTTFQKSVAIIKKPNLLIDSKYLAYHLENDVERIKLASKGTAQKNLLLGTMSELIIAICSLPEQQAIVQEIETRPSVCDKIEKDIETNLEKAEDLRQSILKKAFEGKLLNERELAEVRGAEDWEPVEVLLEKIKAEKTQNGEK